MRSFPFAAVLFLPALASLFVDPEERDPNDFTDLSFGLKFKYYHFSSEPSSLELHARQQGYCTRPGGIQCPNMPTNCCPPGDICQIATQVCCPSYGQQCGGQACCAPGAVCCPSVSTGCCAPGATCCGSTCCGPGVQCRDGVCRRQQTTSSATPTTSIASCNFGMKRAPCPSASPVETRVPTVSPLVFDYDKLSKKPKPKYNDAQRAERERSLKELFTSMCLGMESRGKLTGTTQSEIFTFQGDKKQKDANRRAAGCKGSPCAGFPGESCDEYPFASTKDGGANAIWNCIPEMAQDIQGGVISSWKGRNGVTTDTHFEIQILNWNCKNPPKRRRADPVTTLSGVYDTFPPFSDEDQNNHVLIHLGDLSAGKYSVNSQINGTVTAAYVVDNEGEEFAMLNSSQTGAITLDFQLEYDSVGMSLIMDTVHTEMDYTMKLQNTTTRSSALASRDARLVWIGIVAQVLCGLVWGLASFL